MAHARRLAVAAVSALVLGGCTDANDRAAKERVFSPEEPTKAVRAAAEPIDASALAKDNAAAMRVLTLGAAEAVERLGPHKFTASASFVWMLGRDNVVKLSEQRVLEQAGQSEWSLHTENDRDHGLDFLRLGDRAFARAKYHPFRERRRDRGQGELLRKDAFGILESAAGLLNNRLGLSAEGEESVQSRRAYKYQFELAPEPLQPLTAGQENLPELKYPAGGPDPSTARRAFFVEKREPTSVKGTLWVDAQTGVPLKSELTAQVTVPPQEGGLPATLTLKVRSELSSIGEKPALAEPKEFLPDEDRPPGVAAALKRFDIVKTDGGIVLEPPKGAAPAKRQEKPESDEDEEP